MKCLGRTGASFMAKEKGGCVLGGAFEGGTTNRGR